ncbi:MAG: hypothetical protein AB1782_16465 [Cyanobacteriota bacterium]
MANLSKTFKTRQDLCEWLKKNKPILQEETGFEFTDLQIANDLLIGSVKINSSFKVLIMPDFNFNDDSLNFIKNELENPTEECKYIAVVIIAESFPDDLYSYYKTLRNYVRMVLPLYLKVDKDNKPVFDYPKIPELTA